MMFYGLTEKLTESAMSYVEAVYRHGVFEPLGPVKLHEDQRFG